jgi:hypothetical protein
MRLSFSAIISGLFFALSHWRLILSLRSFPALPTDWKSSTQVRKFLIEALQSNTLVEIITLTPTKLDDQLRLALIEFAQNDLLWNTAWEIAFRVDNDDSVIDRRITFRDRIRNRILGTSSREFITEVMVVGTEDLAKKIKALSLIFDKDTLI